jgi:hypothetical protein
MNWSNKIDCYLSNLGFQVTLSLAYWTNTAPEYESGTKTS